MSCPKAGAAAVGNDGDEMVIFELEAAEALAGLGRSSAVDSFGGGKATSYISQDLDIADHECCGYASNQVLIRDQTVESIPNKLCSTSHQSSSANKLRKNMNEAEKEARKLRRVLANRESARQTIRRRQAMYLDLTRKSAELTEENENLKKEKELAMEEYNSLRERNKFLKTQVAKRKKAELGEMQEEPKSSKAEISHSATTNTPIYPSLIPYFWPSVMQPSDVFQFQCLDHTDLTSSSHKDIPCCSHRNSTPFYVLPVPWFPYLPNSTTMFHSNVGTNDVQNVISFSEPCGMFSSSDNNHLSLDLNLRADVSSSPITMSAGIVQGARSVLMPDINTVSAHEHMEHGLLPKNYQEPNKCTKKPEESFAASEARRRRKELMKLKNTNCHHVPTRY